MNDGFAGYLLDITEENYFNLFPLETLVCLTPDSEHTFEDVTLNKVYILGGLVDESIQKEVTFQKAWEHSVKTACLKIRNSWSDARIRKIIIQRYWPSTKYLMSWPLTRRLTIGLKP